ncbi:MAG: substrate-binding domain-containing protein [Lachnospiraceae bacterium]
MIKNNKRRLLTILLVLVIIICYTTGFHRISSILKSLETQPGESMKKQVAIITKSTESAFWKSVFAGANAAGTEYNIMLTIDGPENEEDFETQNEMLREAASAGAEVIVFSAIDYNANAETVDELAKSGIEFVIIDSDVNSDMVSARIGTDNYMAGKMAATAALSSIEEELVIGIVNFDVNSANGQEREEGFRDVVLEDDRVVEIHTVNVVSTTEAAMEGTKELLELYPEINVIATFNEWTSLGVGYAIEELVLEEEISVVAFDSNVASIGMLENGAVDALIVQNPYAMGYLSVEMAYQLINDMEISDTHVDTSTTLITRDNMFDNLSQQVLFSFE